VTKERLGNAWHQPAGAGVGRGLRPLAGCVPRVSTPVLICDPKGRKFRPPHGYQHPSGCPVAERQKVGPSARSGLPWRMSSWPLESSPLAGEIVRLIVSAASGPSSWVPRIRPDPSSTSTLYRACFANNCRSVPAVGHSGMNQAGQYVAPSSRFVAVRRVNGLLERGSCRQTAGSFCYDGACRHSRLSCTARARPSSPVQDG
jgi:hypothetical protein